MMAEKNVKPVKKKRIAVLFAVIVTVLFLFVFFKYFVSMLPYPPYFAVDPLARSFETASYKNAKLELRDETALIVLKGDSESIGEAHGRLLAPQISEMTGRYLDRYLKTPELRKSYTERAGKYESFIPEEFRAEMRALAKAAEVPYEDVLLGNTFVDMDPVAYCSTFFAGSGRTESTAPLFGRNLDFPAFGVADRYDLLFMMKPEGKIPFVAIGWPGMVGVLTGINAYGVAVSINLSYNSTRVEGGCPMPIFLRRVLENATNVEAASQILDNDSPASGVSITMVDRRGRAMVAEMAPTLTFYRYPRKQLLFATNMFVHPSWPRHREDDRFALLKGEAGGLGDGISLRDMKNILHGVNLGGLSLQSVIFEPVSLRMHLSMTDIPATGGEYRVFDLKEFFEDYLAGSRKKGR